MINGKRNLQPATLVALSFSLLSDKENVCPIVKYHLLLCHLCFRVNILQFWA